MRWAATCVGVVLSEKPVNPWMSVNIRVASAVDSINREFKQGIIKPAALFEAPEHEKKWAPRSEFKSGGESKKDSPLPDGLRFQNHSEDFAS